MENDTKVKINIVDTEKDSYSDLPLYRLNEASSKDIKIKIVTKKEVQSLVDFKEKINKIEKGEESLEFIEFVVNDNESEKPIT